jgi:Zn-dependent protease
MSIELIIFQLIVLIYSIVLHEIAHGYAAYRYGDNTALYQGRLSMNPLVHLDMFGSILLPLMLFIGNSPILAGWAKPVPVNESNLRPYKLGSFVVSIAGVAINFAIAFVFTLLALYIDSMSIKTLCYIIVTVNVALGLFNLIPFPSADGYRIISIFLPTGLRYKIDDFLNNNFHITIISSIILASILFSFFFPYISGILRQIIF